MSKPVLSEIAYATSQLITKQELRIAVDWWTERLMGKVSHNNGDAFQSAFANAAASTLDALKDWQIEYFKVGLLALLAVRCANSGWNEEEPNWGSGNRTLSCDYCPCSTLRSALEFAMISGGDLRLPIKTCMWIRPGHVSVRLGYSGKETDLLKV